ncbi:hypothetical protein KAR91_31380 [Candidatus Pacearchaeota archaeon]|nr:hypothetical protein [Candidatus Pacearchaeota archaeon]
MKSFIVMVLMLFLSFVLIASAGAQVLAQEGHGAGVRFECPDFNGHGPVDLVYVNIGKMFNRNSMMFSCLNCNDMPFTLPAIEKTGGNLFACSKYQGRENIYKGIVFCRAALIFRRC